MDWIDRARAARVMTPLVAALALNACSVVGPRSSPLPSEGPTMDQIYRERAGEADRNRAREALPLRPAVEPSPGPVREAAMRQIETRFARVPNPDLIMVVFPHLAQGKYPVPGYVTAFPMYDGVHYLLPGEAGSGPAAPTLRPLPAAPAPGEATTVRTAAQP